MTDTKPTRWPRAYLLSIYNAAIEHGHIRIHPISEEDARSLTQSLYRLRRRSDKAMAHLITPEFHLVTVGRWQDNALYVYYSTTETSLPTIEAVDGSSLPATLPQSTERTPEISGEKIPDEEDIDIDSYVKQLVDGAHKKDLPDA